MRHFLAMATFAAAISAFAAADVTMRPDGDVQTLDSALAKIRAYRADGTLPPGREALVEVEDGRYPVTAATVFTPEDSNVRIVARHGGRAVFDGGVRLPPFSAGADGIWRTCRRESDERCSCSRLRSCSGRDGL